MKVLIIDDSRSARRFAHEILSNEGFVVTEAEDGAHAVQLLEQNPVFDIILCDWIMPNLNGIEFLETVRDRKLTSTPIIMMTTQDSPEDIAQAINAGATEYVMKPYTEDILIDKINLVLGGI